MNQFNMCWQGTFACKFYIAYVTFKWILLVRVLTQELVPFLCQIGKVKELYFEFKIIARELVPLFAPVLARDLEEYELPPCACTQINLSRDVGIVAESKIPAGQGYAVGRAEVVELFAGRLKRVDSSFISTQLLSRYFKPGAA